jgi:hypothetical protein
MPPQTNGVRIPRDVMASERTAVDCLFRGSFACCTTGPMAARVPLVRRVRTCAPHLPYHHDAISKLTNASRLDWISKASHSGLAANSVDRRDGEMLAIVELHKDDPPNGGQLRPACSSTTTARAKEVLKPSSTHVFRDENSYLPETYGLRPEALALLMRLWRERALNNRSTKWHRKAP